MTTPLRDGAVLVRGRPAPYHVRYSRRARHAAVHIHPRRGIEVVLPAAAPARDATDLLREKAAWLDRHALDVHRAQRRVPMRSGARLPLRGTWLPLQILPAATPRVSVLDAHLRVHTPAPGDAESIRSQLERWYRALARRTVLDRIKALRHDPDERVRRLTIRDQDSCWGSCSGSGTLSFNWRLAMTPPPVFDAVVVHELIHLRIPDHSQAFWRALDQRFPRHRACRRWLDANAYRLGL